MRWLAHLGDQGNSNSVQLQVVDDERDLATRNTARQGFDVDFALVLGFVEDAADAVVVVADANCYTDRSMKGEPYMWCWINGPTWFYVKDYPIPVSRKRTS